MINYTPESHRRGRRCKQDQKMSFKLCSGKIDGLFSLHAPNRGQEKPSGLAKEVIF